MPSGLDKLFSTTEDRNDELPVLCHAVLEADAVADEEVFVRVPAYDPEHLFGPARWNGDGLPEAGDDVLLAFDNSGDPWVVAAWPPRPPEVGGGSVTVDDTLTLDLDFTGSVLTGEVLNSPLLGGQTGAYYRDRSNHTGTQTASTISDFSAASAAVISSVIADSDDIPEGSTNLYYTNTRADARIAAAVGVSVQAYDADLTTWAGKTAPSGTVVGTTDTQTLSGKTLTTPTISSFTNATHTHADAAGGGTIAHSDLTGLTSGDPHTQYPLMTGRAGGQSLYGGTDVAGEILTLRATSASGATTGGILVDFSTRDVSTGNNRFPFGIKVPSTLNANITMFALGQDNTSTQQAIAVGAGGGIRALNLGGIYTISGTPSSIPFLVFNFGPTITFAAGTSPLLGEQRIFNSAGAVTLPSSAGAMGNLNTSGEPWSNFRSGTNFTAAVGGTTARIRGPFVDFHATPFTLGTGWTMDQRLGLWFRPPIGAGTLTEAVAVEIPDWAGRAGALYCIRNADATAQSRHKAPMVVGANAAPSNAFVALEVQSVTQAFLLPRMTTTQRDAMTPLDGMVIYNTTAGQKQTREAGAWVAN